jgi:gliding motility-associated-like protein
MLYLKNILFFLFLLNGINSVGQIIGPNLVKNPSFEEYYSCPNNSGQLNKSKNWWGVSTEFYNICNTGGVSVPINYNGFQSARTGVAYSGFIHYAHSPNLSYNETYNETIKNLLHDSLKKNRRYCINYFASLAEFTYKYTQQLNGIIVYDSMGALFSAIPVYDDVSTIICDTCAKFAKSVIGIDTLNWFKISGSIIANGGEKYLTIGKFNLMNWPPNTYSIFYVYVDDVSVCECSFDINLGQDTSLCEGESLILKPNLPNASYTWQDSSQAPIYEVKQPGTYWVRAYVAEYDITTTDTIVITAGDDSFCNPPLTIPNVITPNGDSQNDNFQIQNAESYEIALQIYNRWGTLIYETANYQNDFSCKECADGVYYYVLKAKSKRNGREKEYKGSLTIING